MSIIPFFFYIPFLIIISIFIIAGILWRKKKEYDNKNQDVKEFNPSFLLIILPLVFTMIIIFPIFLIFFISFSISSLFFIGFENISKSFQKGNQSGVLKEIVPTRRELANKSKDSWMNNCPNCGTELTKNALFCHKCGTSKNSIVRFCQYCGTAKLDEAIFCYKCGNVLKNHLKSLQAPRLIKEKEILKCKNCNNKKRENSSYCNYCGTKF